MPKLLGHELDDDGDGGDDDAVGDRDNGDNYDQSSSTWIMSLMVAMAIIMTMTINVMMKTRMITVMLIVLPP